MAERVKVAVLGTGNIGTDLLLKLLRRSQLEIAVFAGVDPASAGIARAQSLGVRTSTDGIDAVLADDDVRVVFDASSAGAHRRHAPLLEDAGKLTVDLTPAAVGPLVVPAVNLDEHLDAPNVNLITCGGQATIPIVRALHDVGPLRYAEMVSTISSASAGPGTRQNIDEFTRTTARALERVGGAAQGKAIIILNPADPPILMGNTVMAIPESPDVDEQEVRDAVDRMVAEVAHYVPGYRLKAPVAFDEQDTPWGRATVIVVLLQVEGAGDFLPRYAGNLDIMTSAAARVGERMALAQAVAT
ncbi:MAG: acetaldehyde dehydrogenase (acetylating) [Actinobacteria bacterium]|nr:MAG: acetaldehyde dehydrogenase (acetylating) [Actinomycetota bacterium]